MSKFNLASLLNNQPPAKDSHKRDFEIVPISVFDIEPSQDNFYSVEQIQELKAAIEIAGGIKQNGVVVPLGNGKYKLIAGHRRRAILERNQEKGIRSKLAEALNTSQAAIGRLDAIAKHLIPELQQEIRENRLGISAAYELSGLPESEQRQVLSEYSDGKGFSVDAARQKKQSAAAVKTPPETVAMLDEIPKEKIRPKLAAESELPAEKQSDIEIPVSTAKKEPVVGMAAPGEINILQQIDTAKELLEGLAAKKFINGEVLALIVKVLDFYRHKEGWDSE